MLAGLVKRVEHGAPATGRVVSFRANALLGKQRACTKRNFNHHETPKETNIESFLNPKPLGLIHRLSKRSHMPDGSQALHVLYFY